MIRKKQKQLALLVIALGISGILHAQESSNASGGNATGVGGTISYSVGQVNFNTVSGNNGSIIQGVQQPYEISTTVGINVVEIKLELTIYPNPTQNYLTLSLGNYNDENLHYQLYSTTGKLLATNKILEEKTVLGFQNYPAGIYLLNVQNQNSIIKTFRIVKN
jgi:hypothetical protein